MNSSFVIGQQVRYLPGTGTYGYEDALEADGRLPGIVKGYTKARIQVELRLERRGGIRIQRAVAAESLQAVQVA